MISADIKTDVKQEMIKTGSCILSLSFTEAAFEICLGTQQLPKLLTREICIFFTVRQQIIAGTYFLIILILIFR